MREESRIVTSPFTRSKDALISVFEGEHQGRPRACCRRRAGFLQELSPEALSPIVIAENEAGVTGGEVEAQRFDHFPSLAPNGDETRKTAMLAAH